MRAARHFGNPQPAVETEGITRLPVGLCALIWAVISLPMWGGVVAFALWGLR